MKAKMAALFASLMIALAVLGFAYAYWNETLTIAGTVETGELDVKFSSATCTDNEGGIDVGTCTVSTTDQTMTVTIENAYPSYECTVTFTIDNTGTIPAKVTATDIPTVAELSITLEGLSVGQVISKDGGVSATLKIHVTGTAAEGSTYTFTVTIVFGQFNAP